MATSSNCTGIRAKVYFGLRFYLHKNRELLRFVQALRAYLVLGPLRRPLIWYYRNYRPNVPLKTQGYPLFSSIDADKIANAIEETGYARFGNLPHELVSRILDYCDVNKRISYWNPHNDCEAIRRIAQNAAIVEIARQYFGAEPILWLTRMKWSFPSGDGVPDLQPSIHEEPIAYDPHGFHYDVRDFKSLTVFVYLTDVDDLDSGAHVIIEGTHNNKSIKEIRNIILDDDMAHRIYGDRIRPILGKKGTVFAEETSAYHKIAVCKKRRLILMIDYVLARKVPPERPVQTSQ
jgi:hypothetical protein